MATGTPTMTYTLSTGCLVTYGITVNPTPAAIGGTTNVCTGATSTLTDATAGGNWTSSNSLVAAVGSTTGIVSGASAGTATITYTLPAGCNVTTPFTVNPTPAAVTGADNVCVGSTTTIADASSGGTFSSSNGLIATVGAVSGIVSGVAAGTVTITYTLPAGCFVTFPFTVNPIPAAITGVSNICVGLTTTLSDATAGGLWSSSNGAVASVGSTTGIVTGASAGTATITYTLSAGCTAVFNMTVNPNPAAITGVTNVCVGLTTTLSDGTTGGTWQSSNILLATVGSTTGVVTGVATGTPIITYILSTGCIATQPVTVNPIPPAITGVMIVCSGLTTTLSDPTGGGTWTSANPAIATIGSSSGVVTGGTTTGTVAITYTLPTSCLITATVTVNPQPAAITGATFVCVGQTTTLSDATAGGNWTSSNNSLATIGSGTGLVTGVAVGVPTMTYTLPAGCFATYNISVNPMPVAITGVTTVCAGQTTTLSDATGGGTWTSSNTSIATVGSTTGVVTGVSGTSGIVNITYTLPGGCLVFTPLTVNPTPVAIAGSNNVCLGLTTTLTDATSGGAWSSSAAGVAAIGTSGIVSGVTAGTATISYTLPAGCFATLPFTVNPLPANITGVTSVCQGLTTTLSDASAGGTWTSSNSAIASIGFGTGIVNGVAAGTATITYTLPTSCIITTGVTVNPLPTVYNVTGGGAYCSGGTGVTVGVSNSQVNVNYQLYVGGVATGSAVGGTGAAISFGLQTTVGTYTVIATNAITGCVNNMLGSATVTMNLNPTVYNITGGGGYCSGGTGVLVGLNNSQSGINYQLYNGSGAVGLPVAGTGLGSISFGLITGAGTYFIVATNAVTACTSNMAGTAVITINPLPTQYTVTGGGAYCAGGTGVTIGLSNSTLGVNYTVSNGVVSSTLPGTGAALSFGLFTSLGTYTVTATNATTLCTSTMLGTAVVTSNVLPTVYTVTGGGAYCSGGTGVAVGLSNSQSGVSYQLMVGGSATGAAVAGTGSPIGFGLQTTAGTYTVVATNTTTGCTSTTATSVVITINPLPGAFNVSGGGSYCVGGTGVVIGLSGSVIGINYTLMLGGIAQTTFAGTGASFNFLGT